MNRLDQRNMKDERIYKLHKRGLTVPQIARKLGNDMPTGIERIKDGLSRKGVFVP